MPSSDLPVYRIVNGKRERVPGDVRDSHRRYSSTHDENGNNIHLEYTDEQERERDEEERVWKEQAPQRAAEAKRREEESRKFRESLTYQKRVVAFLDVLGWAEALKRSTSDAEYAKDLGVAIAGLGQHVAMADWMRGTGGGFPGDPQITQFSDSLLISVLPEKGLGLSSLFSTIRVIGMQLAQAGLLVRGGIAYGDLIHKGSMVYGQALVDAYKLESERAVHPRIVLSDDLARELSSGQNIYDREGNLIEVWNSWVQDFGDRLTFMDFLAPWPRVFDPDPVFFAAQLRPYKKILEANLSNPSLHVRAREKYLWLARYFNWTLDRYPVTDIPKFEDPMFVFANPPKKFR